jgi:DNA-directed RNA polymerase specialized sigma24 family protein
MPGSSVCELPAGVEDALRHVSLESLCAEVRLQESNFVSGRPSHDAAGVELFRRAIDDGDEQAWSAVVALYSGLLIAQAGRRVVRSLVGEDDGFCVDRAFQRFWRATRTNGLHDFKDLASILKYLKMCLWSVLLDEARQRKRQACLSLDDVPAAAQLSGDPAALVTGHLTSRELWQAIDAELLDDRERVIARLSFVAGLTPREILARHADRFASVTDIYRLKRNVVERLRRSPAIKRLLD